jgi:uncharacterized damage-inducible protein DinB
MTAESPLSEEAVRIADELTRAMENDPWHGDSVSAILSDVTSEMASAKPGAPVHSIWEIVRHMTAWTAEVERRIDGLPPGLPEEGDWPAPSGAAEKHWRRDVEALMRAHRQLRDKVKAVSDASLLAPTRDQRNRPTGAGVTRYVLLHGLAQHHAYHAGQIAILKRWLA